jgi:tetratricopeptide (TPR) repeat protein
MDYKKLEKILLYFLLIITAGVYLYTVAPTLSFWDCGEFISSAYTLAVPHPPGTPLYVLIGRVWLMIVGLIAAIVPISKEVAWHMNLLGLGISVVTIFLLYRMILKIFRMWHKQESQIVMVVVAFAACLGISFYYTYWTNAIETEVYAASTFFLVLINYLALLWYESVKRGEPKNKYLLLSFYLIFLASGFHMTPFLIFIPFYIFIIAVERRYIKDTLLLLLGILQVLFFALMFILPESLHVPALIVIGIILISGIVLPLNNPHKYRNWRFFWLGVLLLIVAVSAELYLPIRAAKLTELYKDKQMHEQYLAGENIAPRINECDPGENFNAFSNVLHRAQYGPQRIIPRQTQDATGFNLIEGLYWQVELFVRYLSWQPIPQGMNRLFRYIILAVFYVFGIWGMVELYKREKKLFLLIMLIMFMVSFGTISYLNLKFSPSDGNPKHQPREVRERDYFFHPAHVYFGLFIGLGFYGFMETLKKESKNSKLARWGGLGAIVAYSLVPPLTNIRVNNRFGDFIPKDYGYNMLVSCDDGSLVFTNGDNDTFPLWFAQEVLNTKRSVVIANLSLINTNWYIKQLKYWGAPVSFSEEEIDLLEPIYDFKNRRVIYVKDIMVRDILATNAGIRLERRIERGTLKLDQAFFISQEEFATRYLKNYKGEIPIYFATTVSEENYRGFRSYLKLEGLVYRVIGDSIEYPNNIDIQKTRDFFYQIYRYTGVFDPPKQEVIAQILPNFTERKERGEFYNFTLGKDENTKRLYSNYAAGLFNLGLALRDQRDIPGAIDAWRFAILFEPQPIYPFLYNLGLLYAQIGMIDSAEQYFSMIDVDEPQILAQIGSIYGAMGHNDKAIEYFQRAITINPRHPQAYFGLFTVYLAKHDTLSATQVLQNWLRINPSDTSVRNMLKELTQK